MTMVRVARASGLGLRGLWGIFRASRSVSTGSPLPRPGRPNTQRAWMVLFVAVESLAEGPKARRRAKVAKADGGRRVRRAEGGGVLTGPTRRL